MVDAVHADEGGEVVAGVGVHEDAGLWRPRRRVAARRGRHDAGEDAGAEDQRDVGMERLERLVEQAIEVEHVRAASSEERFRDPQRRVGARHLASFEVDEDGGALGRELRLLRHFGQELRYAVANGHYRDGTTPAGRRYASDARRRGDARPTTSMQVHWRRRIVAAELCASSVVDSSLNHRSFHAPSGDAG